MRLSVLALTALVAFPLWAQPVTPAATHGLWRATGNDAAFVAIGPQSLTLYDWMGDDVNLLADCYATTHYGSAKETSPGQFVFLGENNRYVITPLALEGNTLRAGSLDLGEDVALSFEKATVQEADLVPRCTTADLERPGLGPSVAAALGTPLTLPPGLVLDGSITAANLDGTCPGGRPTMPVVGTGMVCLCVPLRNTTDSTVAIEWTEFPEGIVIVSASEGFQSGLLVEKSVIRVPPEGPGPGGFGAPDAVVCGQCANKHRGLPGGGESYGSPQRSADRAARYLTGLLAGRVVDSQAAEHLQSAVWELTDGRGLTAQTRDTLTAALQTDADGDGAGDADEGTGDADGDGVPDSHDADVTRHVAPLREGDFVYLLPSRLGVFAAIDPGGDGTAALTRLPASAAAHGVASALPWAFRIEADVPIYSATACFSLFSRPPASRPSTFRLFRQDAPGAGWQEVTSRLNPGPTDPDQICADELDALGTFVVTAGGVVGVEDAPAPAFSLDTPAPNPAAGVMTLGFTVAAAGHATLALYDARAGLITALFSGEAAPGAKKQVSFDTSKLAPGLYFARLTTAAGVATRPLVVVR